jgi:hypothetical protein
MSDFEEAAFGSFVNRDELYKREKNAHLTHVYHPLYGGAGLRAIDQVLETGRNWQGPGRRSLECSVDYSSSTLSGRIM